MIFSLRPQAREDLRLLLEYITNENPQAAYRMRDAILETCVLIAENPKIATVVENLTIPDVRRYPVCGYMRYSLFYRIAEKGVEIIRLGYGGRDWENIFDDAVDDSSTVD